MSTTRTKYLGTEVYGCRDDMNTQKHGTHAVPRRMALGIKTSIMRLTRWSCNSTSIEERRAVNGINKMRVHGVIKHRRCLAQTPTWTATYGTVTET